MSEHAVNLPAPDLETIDLLRDSAASFCQRALAVNRLRALRGARPAFDQAIWHEMCELGWSSIVVPEAAGGLGLGAAALGVVARELGRVVAPEPLIESAAAATLLAACASPAARDELASLLAGDHVIGVALADPTEFPGAAAQRAAGMALGAEATGGGFRLQGVARGIALAPDARAFTVVADVAGAPSLFLIDPALAGCTLRLHEQTDGTTNGDLAFESVQVPATACLASGPVVTRALQRARDLASLATSAYLVGLAERVFDITVEYLKTRQQFGKPIGAFQALQHRAVDLFIHKTIAAAVIDDCLARYDAAGDDATRAIAISRAKYRANETALLLTRQAIQLHGGIGYTDECDVGLYVNRALALAARHGNATHHLRRLAALIKPGDDGEEQPGLAAVIAEPVDGDMNRLSDEAFRCVIRRWFESEYPPEKRYPSARMRWADVKDWYLKLSAKGWVAPAWPREYGGMGLSPAKMLIYIDEQERIGIARAPDMGIQMVGPLLIRHGTEAQRQRYLPKILAGDEVWCQGYSEPNAGSDLASLKTEAVQDGDEFVINGQKTWTTLAQDATHMFCLARTSKTGKQQEGISFFLIDFKQPGVTIRPIKNIAGHEEFCEVFLDDVRVPADCLVGKINEGWSIAKALLGFERIFIGSPKQSQYALKRLEALALGAGLYDDAAFVDRITRLKLDVLDLESTYQRFADIVRRGETLGPDVSLLKIWGTETFCKLSELMVETAGASGASLGKLDFGTAQVDVMAQFYNARPAPIYGGSNEIQRNIIAKGVLRLPGA